MLIPPQNPILRKPHPAAWRFINTASFDGQAEDCFSQTSLHLSFTEYNAPIEDGVHGGQDSQVCFLESVVSIHDKDVWVGDIVVLAAMKAPNVIRLRPWTPCSHAPGLRPARNLISIECWDEILKTTTRNLNHPRKWELGR